MSKSSTVFVGREKELVFLENLYKKAENQAQLLILYGKVRMGKTQLLKNFFQNRPCIYFLAAKGSAGDQLNTAADLFIKNFEDNFAGEKPFSCWPDFFEYLGKKLKNQTRPGIIVFDEFQHLIESDEKVAKYFQQGFEKHIKATKTLVILAGSSIAVMEKYCLNDNSPLAKQKTAQWRLSPFTFSQIKQFYSSTTKYENIVSLYSLVGGVPAYIKELDVKQSLRENIAKNMLGKSSFLSIEPELIIASEFHEPKIYLTILKAIATGKVKFADIQNKTGLTNSQLSMYLSNLLKLKIVKRELPITTLQPEKSKKGVYSINDNFLRFYFSFIFPNLSLIEINDLDLIFEEKSGILKEILLLTYGEISLDEIIELCYDEKIPYFERFGSWYDDKSEISIVGINEKTRTILFADCYWENRPIDAGVLSDLREKSKRVDWNNQNRTEVFALCSKSGFNKSLHTLAEKEKVILIEKDRLILG